MNKRNTGILQISSLTPCCPLRILSLLMSRWPRLTSSRNLHCPPQRMYHFKDTSMTRTSIQSPMLRKIRRQRAIKMSDNVSFTSERSNQRGSEIIKAQPGVHSPPQGPSLFTASYRPLSKRHRSLACSRQVPDQTYLEPALWHTIASAHFTPSHQEVSWRRRAATLQSSPWVAVLQDPAQQTASSLLLFHSALGEHKCSKTEQHVPMKMSQCFNPLSVCQKKTLLFHRRKQEPALLFCNDKRQGWKRNSTALSFLLTAEKLLAGLLTSAVLTNLFSCLNKSVLAENSYSAEYGIQTAHRPTRHSETWLPYSLVLPAPLWCTVGNTEIKCRSEVGDEALSAGGRFQSLEYTHPLCSQTSCGDATHFYQHSHLLPLLPLSHCRNTSGISIFFLDLPYYM